ncbi:hypothetical protein BaRGS_00019921 [Batillaria attramentaria]|uniref:Uncharacterized protein n=1 Tax=Batillaria attramentaria TaxID=370345 RepID=A0ABD0KNI9_9CAEN
MILKAVLAVLTSHNFQTHRIVRGGPVSSIVKHASHIKQPARSPQLPPLSRAGMFIINARGLPAWGDGDVNGGSNRRRYKLYTPLPPAEKGYQPLQQFTPSVPDKAVWQAICEAQNSSSQRSPLRTCEFRAGSAAHIHSGVCFSAPGEKLRRIILIFYNKLMKGYNLGQTAP